MTPHNEAKKGDYAETVLLPGDPQRAEWIAEKFLDRCALREPLARRARLHRQVPWHSRQHPVDRHGHASLAIYVHELLDAYRARR